MFESLKKAAGGIIGGVLGSFTSGSISANATNKANKMQIAWEREKAKNAHQWEVQDLTKAGINPIMTASGSSASSIAGGGANFKTPNIPDFGSAIINGINSAARASEVENNAKKIGAEVDNINASTTQTQLNNKLVEKYGDKEKQAEIANKIQDTALIKANSALANEKINTEIQDQWLKRAQIAETQNRSVNESLKIPENARKAEVYRGKGGKYLAYAKEWVPVAQQGANTIGMLGGLGQIANISNAIENAISKKTSAKKAYTNKYNPYNEYSPFTGEYY